MLWRLPFPVADLYIYLVQTGRSTCARRYISQPLRRHRHWSACRATPARQADRLPECCCPPYVCVGVGLRLNDLCVMGKSFALSSLPSSPPSHALCWVRWLGRHQRCLNIQFNVERKSLLPHHCMDGPDRKRDVRMRSLGAAVDINRDCLG